MVRRQARQRRAHKKFLLHPATIFGLICCGVFIVGWTFRALADSYDVSAKVALTRGAHIVQPAANGTFTASPISVSGDCPDYSYVKIYRNGSFAGVAYCGSGSYQLNVSLIPGLNTLSI